MDDNRIEIVARLDTSKSAILKIEADLSNISDKLNADKALQIIANVDLGKTTQRIQSQLTTISKNLKLDIGNIKFDTSVNTTVEQMKSLGKVATQTQKEIKKAETSLANISGNYLNPIKPVIKGGYMDADATMAALKKQLSSLSQTITITGNYDDKESTQALKSMTAEIKAASGEVRTLTFAWNEWDKAFEVTTGKYSDKGVGKIQQDIVRLEKELANFKASHQAIETGLTEPLTKATDAINNLKDGVGSVETAQKALDNLKTEAAKIGTNLKSTGSSFNIFDNATNKAQNFDNTIKELAIDIGKLQFTDKKSGLAESLDLAKQKLEEFRRVEGESGKGLEWSQRYAEINSLLQSVTNNLKAAKKEESEIDAFNRKLDAHNQEIQKKLDLKEQEIQKAKELNEVEMQNYWQGRFEESVKGMTAENQVLKDMKKYYEDLNKEAIKAESQKAKDENRIANLQNRISRLTAEVNRYATANQRATTSMEQMSNGKTFAVEWSRITTEMAKGADLTDRELKDLSADMAVFRKEAQAAGLAGESAFGKFLNSFKTMSSYITANMVFNFVKRQIRELVNEVTEVDTAMTELRKVTEATNEQFAAFAISAGKTGRELGASVSDVINATATFARLGESLPDAEELGRVATLYKNVGDGIDITTASEDIVSTMKAFKIEAKDAITIVDKLNEVGNNFAISSGGIGEALKRSASALAAANNDISESIALITTANTIAQDPTTVGQGIKTVSLRLRSTKSQLVDLGEDAEGAAENISKLREQMLALTGVDIQLDDSTYKSTYQILLEISKVWSRLDDLSQANVLEQLFGKRQANIGAAILENGDLLERVYKTSERASDGIGSAMREQEEYAKSIQYSIDTLKAAYQDFADSVINSDFVKNLLGTAQSFLEVLTKIIDKFGTLPTILTGIAAIGGVKGIGLFGNLEYGLATVGKTLDKLTVIGNYDFGKLYKAYDINMSDFKAFSATEISSLQEYVNALNRGSVSTKEFNEIFKGMREEVVLAADGFTKLKLATDTGAVSEGEYAVATQNLALTQKTATATSKALATALNLVTNIAMTVAISLAIKGLSALVDKLIVTREELEELRNEAVESSERLRKSAETFVEEAQSIDELLQKYQQIHANVSDISQAKDELLQIQGDLIDKFGKEAEGLDLINGKYDENIAKIKEYTREKYNEWKTENAAEIRRAEKVAGYNFDVTRDDSSNVYRRDTKIGRNRIKEIYGNDELAQSLFVIKDVSADIRQIYEDIEGLDMSYGDLLLGGDINAAIDSLSKLINYYKDLGNADEETLQQLTDHLKSLKTESGNIDYYLNNVSSVGNVFESVKSVVVNAFDDMAKIGQVSGDEMRAKWLENLDEMQKGSLKNISTMVSALQDLSEGKGIAANTFWQLVEFDEQGLLNGAKLVGDKFVVTEENMIKLKDQYIQKQIESIKLRQAEHEEAYQTYLNEVKTNEQKLRELPLTDKMYNTEAYRKINQQLETARANAKAYGDDIERDRWLIEYLNQALGNTVDLQKQLEAQQKQLNKELTALNKELDNYQKAYEAKIDGIIKNLEAEENELEKQLDTLEDELDVLEKQQDAIEETLDNYEKVNSYVQKIIDKEIESLEEQRDAIKNTYDERIKALQEENSEREDALDYAQKLANLENARNNKRRVYDEARGWRYESVKEDVVKAENELKSYETSQAVKNLEKERDNEIKAWDNLIKQKEDYKKQWTEWLEEIQDEESEALMIETLGADAREKIAKGDIALIQTFSTQYRIHNNELKRLTDTEIKLKKAEIDAKNADIKASKERIQAWKDYKQQFSTAVNDIKAANADYMKDIGNIQLSESSSLEERGNVFEQFKNRVVGYVNDIANTQSQIDGITASLEALENKNLSIDLEVTGYEKLDTLIRHYAALAEITMAAAWGRYLLENGGDMDSEEAKYALKKYAHYSTNGFDPNGFSKGGVVNYTGLAMLHGSPQKAETVFNANDSAKLYEMVHNTPNLMADMLNQATKLSGFKLSSNENSNNSSVSIGAINVYANNPQELAQGLDKQLDRYFRTKLTESYTRRQ